MWAHFDDGWTAYDWASGTVSKVPGSTAASESAHGRFATRGATTWTVHDFTDGSTVGELPMGQDDYGFLSPDGRFLRYFDQMAVLGDGEKAPQPRFYEVDTGASHRLSRGADAFGWTPDGRVLMVDARQDTITTCDASDGACEVVRREIEDLPREARRQLLRELNVAPDVHRAAASCTNESRFPISRRQGREHEQA